MTQTQTQTQEQTEVQAKKQNRIRFGVKGAPVQVTKVYTKPMEHDSNKLGTATQSWILFTPAGKMLRVNTYNGNAGKNFDPDAEGVTHPVPANERDLKRATKHYVEVPIADCPIAVPVDSTATEELVGDDAK